MENDPKFGDWSPSIVPTTGDPFIAKAALWYYVDNPEKFEQVVETLNNELLDREVIWGWTDSIAIMPHQEWIILSRRVGDKSLEETDVSALGLNVESECKNTLQSNALGYILKSET
ncbi:MAG: hypothetical protein O7C75_14810 [Verrucomicrobia bacterium]|nr:hypothetical protein [Verrucomicrobiota bacterium]